MKLGALPKAHAYMRIERPPLLWEAETEDVRILALLGEMIAVGLGRGNHLADLTLNASNVTVVPEAAGLVPVGDYVAITVRGAGKWGPEWAWPPGTGSANPLYRDVEGAMRDSGPYMRTHATWEKAGR